MCPTALFVCVFKIRVVSCYGWMVKDVKIKTTCMFKCSDLLFSICRLLLPDTDQRLQKAPALSKARPFLIPGRPWRWKVPHVFSLAFTPASNSTWETEMRLWPDLCAPTGHRCKDIHGVLAGLCVFMQGCKDECEKVQGRIQELKAKRNHLGSY